MKALVINFYISVNRINIENENVKILYEVIRNNIGQARVLYDENMCIDSKSNFVNDIDVLLKKYIGSPITNRTLSIISNEITMLLKQTEANGYLFRGHMYEHMKNRSDMILLNNEGYDLAMHVLKENYE